jgi:ATP-dependent Lon protease
LTPEDEEEMINEELPDPCRFCLYVTWFYFLVLYPITAGRDKSIKLIDDANAGKTQVLLLKNEQDEDPTKEDIHKIGTVARIL